MPVWLLPLLVLLLPVAAHADLEAQLGDTLQGNLQGRGAGLVMAYLVAFAGGLATSLTPCVYPLIPITVSLFGARAEQVTRVRALLLATCYVGGIATMYTGLGIFFGLTGKAFGTFMARSYVIVPIGLFFLAMAASMFGAFELALPPAWQTRLSHVGGRGPKGAFLMGLVAGIIAAPCTGPPLAVLLAFVSTQRSVGLGGSLLFTYALGMGVLFFVIAGFALKLPRSGPWMEAVKSLFGVIMIVAALFLLRNVVQPLRDYGRGTAFFLGLHVALAGVGVALGAIHLSFGRGPAVALRKGVGIVVLCTGLFGIVAWMLAPRPTGVGLVWLTDEAEAVARARREGRPLFVDFAAEWCLPCKELELKTFADPRVAAQLRRFVLLRIDCTDPDDRIEAIKGRYGAATLPTVVVTSSDGKELLRLTEFVPPERLLPLLVRLP